MPGVLRYESGDQRLPVFDTDDPDTQTVSIQDGPVTATASAYGEPFAYLPEHRPVMAIDGDPSTSWIVADRGPALDESIVLDVSEPIDHLTLRQPDTVDGQRRITRDRADRRRSRPDRSSSSTNRSLVGEGQRIDIDPTDGGQPHHAADHRYRHGDRRARRSVRRSAASASPRSTSGSNRRPS